MIPYIGDFVANSTVRYFFGTNASTGASVNRTTAGVIRVYKNTSVTERTSVTGITDTSGFDSVTGLNSLSIDLSNNTDAGFYAAGNDYVVVLVGAVIDTQTVNVPLFQFSIENRYPSIANAVWNALLSSHVTANTFGAKTVRALSTSPSSEVAINANNHIAANVHQFQNNVITDAATDATFLAEVADAVWDELYSGHTTVGSFAMLLKALQAGAFAITGTVSTVTNAQTFTTSLIGYVDGAFDHQTLVFIDGSLIGESKPILEFTGASGVINMEEAFTQAPAVGDMFAVLPQHVHAIEAIADGILNRLLDSSGNSVDAFNERTVRSALRAMRNKVEVNNGTIVVYKEDDADAAWEGTLSNTANVTVNPDGGS